MRVHCLALTVHFQLMNAMRYRSRLTTLFPLLLIAGCACGLGFSAASADDATHDHATTGGDDAGVTSHDDHGPHIGEDVSEKTKDIVMDFRKDLAIFTLIIFLLLFTGLKFLAWPKITAALDQRAAVIQQGFADAESARQQAMVLLKEHQGRMEAIEDDVKAIIAEARRDAERTKADIVASAESEAETIKDRALRRHQPGEGSGVK